MMEPKECWNIDVENLKLTNFWFRKLADSHDCPVGKTTSNWNNVNYYIGWSCKLTGTVVIPKKLRAYGMSSATSIFEKYNKCAFLGINTTSGCPGDANGSYSIDIGMDIFLDDFPHLKKQYEKWIKDQENHLKNNEHNRNIDNSAYNHAQIQPDVIELEKQIEELQKSLNLAIKSHKETYILKNKKIPLYVSESFYSNPNHFVNPIY